MASTATSGSNAAATNPKTGKTTASAEDIEIQLNKLRDDLSSLTKTVSEFGRGKADSYKQRMNDNANDLLKMSEDALDSLRAEYKQAEVRTRDQVRENPLQSVAIAAGIGFLAALIMRR